MKPTNNTAASLHTLCVALNTIINRTFEDLESDIYIFRTQELLKEYQERVERLDGYACERIDAGRPNALVVRLTRNFHDMLRELLAQLEDLSFGDDAKLTLLLNAFYSHYDEAKKSKWQAGQKEAMFNDTKHLDNAITSIIEFALN